MTERRKLCPILAAGALADPAVVGLYRENGDPYENVSCVYGRCQFWTGAYTTEGYFVPGCAHVINAQKDSNGRIPV